MLVAEIGLNHLGDRDKPLMWIPRLAEAGVDAVTLQVREEQYYDHPVRSAYRLADDALARSAAVAHGHGLLFGIAIAESSRIEGLRNCGIDFWKTLSWDLLNDGIQEKLAATGVRCFASTGTASIEEIVSAAARFQRVEFIHTQLDLEVSGANLKAIETIRAATGRRVGYGLHCRDHDVLLLAAAFEPSAIFFYVRDSDRTDYPDRDHAVFIRDVPRYTARLRSLAPAVGHGRKEAIPLPKDGQL